MEVLLDGEDQLEEERWCRYVWWWRAAAANVGDGKRISVGGSGSSFAERNSLIDNSLQGSYSTTGDQVNLIILRITYYSMENRNTSIGTAL